VTIDSGRRDAVLTLSVLAAAACTGVPTFAIALVDDPQGPGTSLDDYINRVHKVKRAEIPAWKAKEFTRLFPMETYARSASQNVRLLHTLWGHDTIEPRLEATSFPIGTQVRLKFTKGSLLGAESEIARASIMAPKDSEVLDLGKVRGPGFYPIRLFGTQGAVLEGILTVFPDEGQQLRADLRLSGLAPQASGLQALPTTALTTAETTLWERFSAAAQTRLATTARTGLGKWVGDRPAAIGKTALVCIVLPTALGTVLSGAGAARGIGYCAMDIAGLGVSFIKDTLIEIADEMQKAQEITKEEHERVRDVLIATEFGVQYVIGQLQEKLVPLPTGTPDQVKMKKFCEAADQVLSVAAAMVDRSSLGQDEKWIATQAIDSAKKYQVLICSKEVLGGGGPLPFP
jgi:hypothetical protein